MATPVPIVPVEDDLDLAPLPLHEEEDVPEGSLHHRWSHYLYNVLRALFAHLFASGNVCIFWDPQDHQKFVAPDVFLVDGSLPEPPPRSYRAWRLPKVIFVVEIGSPATADRGPKLERYAEHLQPREVLYTDPIDDEKGERLTAEHVHLYRWSGTAYVEVPHEAHRRVWSEVLASWIGVDESHNLRVYDPRGAPILDYEELEQAYVASQQARLAAEARAREEARGRAAAEEQVRELEQRAQEVARERAAAEERAQEAERRLAELLAERKPESP
jgi:Uma2 family endonuclease